MSSTIASASSMLSTSFPVWETGTQRIPLPVGGVGAVIDWRSSPSSELRRDA